MRLLIVLSLVLCGFTLATIVQAEMWREELVDLKAEKLRAYHTSLADFDPRDPRIAAMLPRLPLKRRQPWVR